MTNPRDPASKPMAEPGSHPQGASTGGIASTADAGLRDAAQRSMEHRDAVPATPPTTGPAGASPASGSTSTPPSGTKKNDASWDEDEGADWRHPPVEPKDKGVLESLGKSVSEAVTGSKADPTQGPKT